MSEPDDSFRATVHQALMSGETEGVFLGARWRWVEGTLYVTPPAYPEHIVLDFTMDVVTE